MSFRTIFLSATTNSNVNSISNDKTCNTVDVKTFKVRKGLLRFFFSEPKGEHQIVFTFLVAH